jgi:hypothetical protein
MALPQGVNFRATAGYVTDGANEDYEISQSNYPRTSAQGNSVGWEGSISGDFLDRNNAVDRRLAGVHYIFAGSADAGRAYRIDLPSTGSYNVRLATGDEAVGGSTAQVTVKDGTTTLLTINDTTAAPGFDDAVGARYSTANWPGSNSASTQTFATTILRFHLAPGPTTGHTVNGLAHVYVEAAGGGGGGTTTAGILLVPGNMRGNLGNLSGGYMQ